MHDFGDRGGWWVVGQVVLFLLLLVALWLGPEADVRSSGAIRAAGGALIILGGGLAVAALARLGSTITPYPAPVAEAVLVDDGLYGLVRHPIYGGLVVMAFGLALADLNVVAGLVAMVFPFFFMAKSDHEEALILEAMPEYAAYRARVTRRLIPWVL